MPDERALIDLSDDIKTWHASAETQARVAMRRVYFPAQAPVMSPWLAWIIQEAGG
ncbi:MAG TPA: hypothetical protein VF808_16635 [Ktedonobacterales bacterium]